MASTSCNFIDICFVLYIQSRYSYSAVVAREAVVKEVSAPAGLVLPRKVALVGLDVSRALSLPSS